MARPAAPPGPSRRALLAGGIGVLACPPATASPARIDLLVRDDLPGIPISPLVFGSSEIGVMDGGPPSALLDRRAGVSFRRLGGDLLTGYNWVNNASNAGKNYHHSNGPHLLEALQIPPDRWNRPAAVIEAMHEASLDMGATSLVTLPLAGFVAADRAGVVTEGEAAPSPRFVPVRWNSRRRAGDDIDPAVADMPHLIARLVDRYGHAGTPQGIRAYALDNEPELWFQNHPRLMPQRITIEAFIARSVAAARVIKSIDPHAQVFGPASWGATGMVSFQDAPDWPRYRRQGSFLAAYLDAFRIASQEAGQRLLDALDVHWYAFHRRGNLFRSEDPALDEALLDAPRSLDEPGFREESWVAQALRPGAGHGLGLPILPSLRALAERWFPGTALAVTEFNYGGAGRLAAGLAVADALGRFMAGEVRAACHWGSLAGWLGEAYRLYRLPDAAGGRFAGTLLPLAHGGGADIRAYAAADGNTLRLVLINRSRVGRMVEMTTARRLPRHPVGAWGFDAELGATAPLQAFADEVAGLWRIPLPALAARRYDFG